MSVKAMNLVWCTPIQPPARKSVALNLADHCNDSGESLRLSHATVALETGMSRDQAKRYMRSFVQEGVLEVLANASGGAPGTVPHYRLNLSKLRAMADAMEPSSEVNRMRQSRGLPALMSSQARVRESSSGPVELDKREGIHAPPLSKTGGAVAPPTGEATAPRTGGMDALRPPETGCIGAPPETGDGVHGSRRGGAPTPETGCMGAPLTTIEPNTDEPKKKTRTREPRAFPDLSADVSKLLEGVDAKVLADWLIIRKEKRLPLTLTAMQQIAAEVEKAGLGMDAALRYCCGAGWAAFRADWHARREGSGNQRTEGRAAQTSRHAGYDERDYGELGDLTTQT